MKIYPKIPRRIINFFILYRILTTMIFESRNIMHIAVNKQTDERPEGPCFYGCFKLHFTNYFPCSQPA